MHNLALAVLLCLSGRAEAASLSEVRFEQLDQGFVVVHYWLGNPENETFRISLKLSHDRGRTFDLVPTAVAGDVGLVSGSGEKRAVWNMEKDSPGLYGDDYVFAVEGKKVVGKAASGTAPSNELDAAGMEWVTIPGGSFLMGSDDWSRTGPRHQVTVKTFQMAKTLVTFGQYKECVRVKACTPAHVSDGTCYVYDGVSWNQGNLPDSSQGDAQPVVCVDWNQARAFTRWAQGRLPSEAEWEYAARGAGRKQKYPWGDDEPSCEVAAFPSQGDGCGKNSAWPVCSKPKGNTEQGLCDMAGNVWVWLQDWYHDSYNGAPADGSAWEFPAGSSRVVRGGSWNSFYAKFLRAAYRLDYDPAYRYDSFGIRLARGRRD